jgi:hypothetical protein
MIPTPDGNLIKLLTHLNHLGDRNRLVERVVSVQLQGKAERIIGQMYGVLARPEIPTPNDLRER